MGIRRRNIISIQSVFRHFFSQYTDTFNDCHHTILFDFRSFLRAATLPHSHKMLNTVTLVIAGIFAITGLTFFLLSGIVHPVTNAAVVELVDTSA